MKTLSDIACEREKPRAGLAATKAELARSNAMVSASEAVRKRDKYGRSAERMARLIDLLGLQLEELETAAAEDVIRAEQAAEKTTRTAGPSLRAMIVFVKFGQHQPLNRQADRFAREGVDLSLSTRADQAGAVAELLTPLHALIGAHVMAAGR